MEFEDDQGWREVRGRNRSRKPLNHHKPDIATTRNFTKESSVSTTTFFFTNFPDRYGAKAIFNSFHNYGEVMEVVIPIKRDKGGRRFGFARFAEVVDIYKLEKDLDNVVFGGGKISVNVSRFQRTVEKDDAEGREGRSITIQSQKQRSRTKSISRPYHSRPRNNVPHSYAQALRSDVCPNYEEAHKKVVLSYEVEKIVMDDHSKAFVGVAATPRMTYNIQDAFHTQGYFGVKVTPLGANLALLEGQEEGEVEALLADAKDWLDQWFKEIRPWNTKDIDSERIVWIRLFGVPVHAWNDDFFKQVTKPWGIFMKSDNVTSKKLTMDVARVLIRTSCQKPVDEFIDVKVNGEIFHLRVLEDSYGPMRLMISQSNGNDGRDLGSNCSEEEEEEERRLAEVEEIPVEEIESEGEGENLLALNVIVNANNDPLLICDHGTDSLNDQEGNKDNSNVSLNNKEKLNSIRGDVAQVGGVVKVDRLAENDGIELGQEGGLGGPVLSINSAQAVKGGVRSMVTKSGELGRPLSPSWLREMIIGVWKHERVGCIAMGLVEFISC
jgi:hypothetical protein